MYNIFILRRKGKILNKRKELSKNKDLKELNLLKIPKSFIVTDKKGSLFNNIEILKNNGYDVKIIDLKNK